MEIKTELYRELRNSWAAKRTPHKFHRGLPASLHVSTATTEALAWSNPTSYPCRYYTLYCCFLKLQEKYKYHSISLVEFIISTVNDSRCPSTRRRLFSKYSWVLTQIRTCFWLHRITIRKMSSIRKINRLKAGLNWALYIVRYAFWRLSVSSVSFLSLRMVPGCSYVVMSWNALQETTAIAGKLLSQENYTRLNSLNS